MKKVKVRHKNGKGRPSKVMKQLELFLNDPKILKVTEEATRLAFMDTTLFGIILPETQEKIDKLLESVKFDGS